MHHLLSFLVVFTFMGSKSSRVARAQTGLSKLDQNQPGSRRWNVLIQKHVHPWVEYFKRWSWCRCTCVHADLAWSQLIQFGLWLSFKLLPFTTDINDAICMENSFAQLADMRFGLRQGFKSGPVLREKTADLATLGRSFSLQVELRDERLALVLWCCCFLIRREAFVLFHWTSLHCFFLATSDFFVLPPGMCFHVKKKVWSCSVGGQAVQ